MFRAIFLSTAMVITPVVSHAGGSMASDVRIIRVNPPGSYIVNKIISDNRKAAEKAETQARKEAMRAGVREMENRQKEYQKKVDAYKKQLAKGPKKK